MTYARPFLVALGLVIGCAGPVLAQQAPASTAAATSQIREHMKVMGSDGQHVGTVDKVEGQSILLTRDDPSSGGVHHRVPVTWVASVDQAVTLNKPATQAMQEGQAAPRPGDDPPR